MVLNYAFRYEYYGFPGLSFGVQNFILATEGVVVRNAGFASEPGVFQIFINLAVAISFFRRTATLVKMVVFAAGIATASSTMGFLVFASLLMLASNWKYRVAAVIVFIAFSSQLIGVVIEHYNAKILTEAAFFGRFESVDECVLYGF